MQYFKDKIGSTCVLFLQETHSDSNVEKKKKKKKWKEDFKGLIFLIAYFGTRMFIVKTQQTDKEG